jgi:hypothetical protein
MEILGVCIIFAMALYLIDKNQKWRIFWRTAGASVALMVLIVGGLYIREVLHREKPVTIDMSTAQPINDFDEFMQQQAKTDKYSELAKKYGGVPETLPANFNGWDVPIFAPDGALRDVPRERVNEALQHGGHVAQWTKDKHENWCLTALPAGATIDECRGKFDPNKPYTSISPQK